MATKKTLKTKRKSPTARVQGRQLRQESPKKEKQRWIEGIVIVLLGVYFYYAFITAQPTIIDKIIGKFILMYLFGNAVPIFCLILIVSGILVMFDKLNEYKDTIFYTILITFNFMVFLSIYIPNLNNNYAIIDLFSLALQGGRGGIIGILIAYISNAFLTRTGTLVIIIALTLIELFLIFKSNLPHIFEKMKATDFGLLTLKDKYLDLKDDLEQRKAVREEQQRKQLTEENTAELNINLDEAVDYEINDSLDNKRQVVLNSDTLYQDKPNRKETENHNKAFDAVQIKRSTPKKKNNVPDYAFFMDEQEDKYKTDFFDAIDDSTLNDFSNDKEEASNTVFVESLDHINDGNLITSDSEFEESDFLLEELEETNSSDYLIDLLGEDTEEIEIIEPSKKKAPELVSQEYLLPSLELLTKPTRKSNLDENEIKHNASKIKETLNNFGIDATIRNYERGPSITRYEVKPAPGVKVSKIVNLADDLALALATSDIRIEAPIPGKDAIGIEVPNKKSDIVHIRELIDSKEFKTTKSDIPFTVGKTLSGHNVIGDISSMPHLLIAGSTGSGKSVCINSIIISLLYHEKPEDLKMILIDPKMVELSQYNTIPHLLVPVVTDPDRAAGALNWGIKEMDDRYRLFKESGVRDLESYNQFIVKNGGEKLPRIVIVIDELADLMMTSPKEVESAICRIAQKARACGIHLVIATQRPSVDVITGLIKSNIPSRIAFAVASNTDSRTILDTAGAEKLLGKGDMLYKPVGLSKPLRIQCSFVSDNEIMNVINSVSPEEEIEFDNSIADSIDEHVEKKEESKKKIKRDKLYDQAIQVAFDNKQLSTSMLQRRLSIGYARAGRIMDTLENDGIISGPNGSKPRKLLISEEDYRGIS